MKYLLPCKCGQSVEIEPGQAGQTVVCACGENLLVPSMLQIKTLPVVPEKTAALRKKNNSTYFMPLALFVAGIVCVMLSFPLWRYYIFIPFGDIVFILCFGLGLAFLFISLPLALRTALRPDDANIWSRSFFILGTALFFPAFLLAIYLYLWTPNPVHTLFLRTQFSFGSEQKILGQDSNPIPMDERTILWMTDEYIDRMTPMELHSFFLTLEKPMFSHNFMEKYDAVWTTYYIWVTVNIVMFVLAFISIVVSFFMPKQNVVVTGWSGSEW